MPEQLTFWPEEEYLTHDEIVAGFERIIEVLKNIQ